MMKTKLSAWNYVKNNGRVVSVLVISLALSFLAMYVIHVLLQTTTESFKPIMLEVPKRISYAALSPKNLGIRAADHETNEEYNEAYLNAQEELVERLEKRPGIGRVLYTQVISAGYQAVIGMTDFEVPLVDPEDIPDFLEHMDAKLVDGRLPEGDGEVVVDSVILKNHREKIGDWFQADAYGESFKIVGEISSDYRFCIGTPMGNTNSGWYLVVCNDETTTDLRGLLKEEGVLLSDTDVVFDAKAGREMFEKDVEGVINNVVFYISLVVTVFLALLVLVAYLSFMRNRVNEYCLYVSIGYGRAEIYGMILREMFLLFAMGAFAGLLISFGSGAILTQLLILPRGLAGKMFYGERILRILGIFLFLMGILQIPVVFLIKRIRTIDAIEDYE